MRSDQKLESARRADAEVLAQAFSGSRSSSSTLTGAETADHEALKIRRRCIKQQAQGTMQTAQHSPPKGSSCIKKEEAGVPVAAKRRRIWLKSNPAVVEAHERRTEEEEKIWAVTDPYMLVL